MAYLICLKGADRGQDWELPMLDIEIGRSPNNHVVVHDTKVSRMHCKLIMGESAVKLVDLKSRNGTKVEGKPVTEQVLHFDQVFQVGDTMFLLSPKSLAGRVADILQIPEEELGENNRHRKWDEILWDELTRPRNGEGLRGGSLSKYLDTLRQQQTEEETQKLLSAPLRPKISVKDLRPQNRGGA
jgi:pSer/pThr/pTyr-binding forkhead associated (FHA) protein